MAKTITKTSEKKERKPTKKSRYIEGIGRRKTAVARVRIYPKEKGNVVVNDKLLKDYFTTAKQQKILLAPFEVVGVAFKTTVKVMGSGLNAQADAVRLGMARALVSHDESWRSKLKSYGYLMRDSRIV
ncbi:unnamed protein product, partial [marine sediment metagenome]